MKSERPRWAWLAHVAWALSALVLFFAVATLRAVLDGEREIAASDEAFDSGDLHAAIQHARRAASAYMPQAPHVERGYARLLAIARGAEAAGQPDVALLAWQAQRAAVLESQSLLQPFGERLEEANRNLARLQAARTSAEGERAEVAQRLFRQAQGREQRPPWGALLAAGLFIAAGGLAWFGAQSLSSSGRIAWQRGRWGLLAVAIGAALWAAGAFHG